MKIERSNRNTTLVFKSGAHWAWLITIFSLVVLAIFFLGDSEEGWVNEAGEKLGPTGQAVSSTFFVGLSSLFLCAGVWFLLQRDRRLIIDKNVTGDMTVEQVRWIVKNSRFSIPRAAIKAVKFNRGLEGPDDVDLITYIHGWEETVKVHSGGETEMLSLGKALGEMLDVEFIKSES